MTPKIPLYADIQNRALTSSTGGSVTLPPLTFGDIVLCGLHPLNRGSDGTATAVDLNLRSLRASIGPVMAAPARGTFTLRASPESESAPIEVSASVATLTAAISALPECASVGAYPLMAVVPASDAGCWLIRFNHAGAVPLEVVTNHLFPTAFVRVRAFQDNGVWWHELRLIVAPVVFTGSHERVLPAAPSVRRIRAGSPPDPIDPTINTNEVQALTVPSDFQGTYYLQFNGRNSSILGVQDGPDTIAAIANAMWTDGQTRFLVTNPEANNAYIEFVGPLAASPQSLLTVSVQSFSPGEITFALDLNTADLAEALRSSSTVTLPLEVEVEIVDDGADPADPTVPGRILTLFSADVTIVREQIYAELATVPQIDWEQPPQPKDYIPYTRDQVFTGLQNYITVIGDGVSRSFMLTHNLGASLLRDSVRENTAGGRRILDTEYALTFQSDNQATITFPDNLPAPAENSLAVLLISPFTINAFQSLTLTIAQVIGLQDFINATTHNFDILNAYLPSTNPTVTSATSSSLKIAIPARAEVLFYNPPKLDLTALPPLAPLLLPAVAQATTSALPTPLPAPSLNSVWTAAARTHIPGSSGRIPPSYVDAGGFVASDGRMLFPAIQSAATNSYYPAAFERTLFEFPINEQQLAVGRTLDVEFALSAQLLNANCEGQWVAVIEWGLPVDQADPTNEGANLQSINWSATPILSQRIYLTSLLMTHFFGCRIRRSVSGITADKMLYNGWQTAGTAAPSAPNFVLRARLIQFDTRNNVPNATGWLYYNLFAATDGADPAAPITATIS